MAVALIAAPALAQPRNRPAPPAADDNTPPPQNTSRGENFSDKPAPQLFASDCTGSTCHRGPQGLAKGQSVSGLTNFLRQHYTNGQRSAAALAAYLASQPGDARPSRQRPEPRVRPAAEPDTPKHEPRRSTASRPNHRAKQATAEPAQPPSPPEPTPSATAAPATPAAVAPPPPAPAPPPPKKFDIFD